MESNELVVRFQEETLQTVDENGERWVPAPQVGAALKHTNIRNLIRDLTTAGELKEGVHWCNLTLRQIGDDQRREVVVLSYRGIIRVGMRAETERAMAFRDWAEEVLYQVMATGGYSLPEAHVGHELAGHMPLVEKGNWVHRMHTAFEASLAIARTMGLSGHPALVKANEILFRAIGISLDPELSEFDSTSDPVKVTYQLLKGKPSIEWFLTDHVVYRADQVQSIEDLFMEYLMWARSKFADDYYPQSTFHDAIRKHFSANYEIRDWRGRKRVPCIVGISYRRLKGGAQ